MPAASMNGSTALDSSACFLDFIVSLPIVREFRASLLIFAALSALRFLIMGQP
jgi:hypothetical protein